MYINGKICSLTQLSYKLLLGLMVSNNVQYTINPNNKFELC